MASFPTIAGLHHVTAMTADPKENLRFYTRVLGQRLVKRTVNFDDPTTWHFYYGDAVGTPGTIMTTFPWPRAKPGTLGSGETRAVSYHAPEDSLAQWEARLADHGVSSILEERFGESILGFRDPGGMRLEIVASGLTPPTVVSWNENPVPVELRLRAFHGVTLQLANADATQELLEAMGFSQTARETGPEGEWIRMTTAGARGASVDLLARGHRLPGQFGQGSIHHIAFRVPDDKAQAETRSALSERGLHVTEVKDRTYFRSIYAREPGGVLFEFATDIPGFLEDESREELGSSLKLPAWLEPRRDELENALADISEEDPTA